MVAEVAPAGAAVPAVEVREMRTARRRFVLVAVVLLLLSACRVKMDVRTTIEDDGSGEIVATLLMSQTAREALQPKERKSDDPIELHEIRQRGEDIFERGPMPLDALEDDVPDGWEGERITEEGRDGIRLRSEFDNLEEISARVDSLSGFGDDLLAEFGRTTENVAFPVLTQGFSITREGPEFHVDGEPDAEAYAGATGGANNLLAELTIAVDLPGGVVEHDADEEEGSTLTWTIAPGESRSISATSDLNESEPIEIPWTPIGIGGVTLGMVGLVAWRSMRDRRRAGGDEPPGSAGVPGEVPTRV